MITRVQKWGNSQGLRIAKNLLDEARISVDDEVEVTVQDGEIIVRPVTRRRGRYDLRKLVAQMPDDYEPCEEDWGAPSGKEAW